MARLQHTQLPSLLQFFCLEKKHIQFNMLLAQQLFCSRGGGFVYGYFDRAAFIRTQVLLHLPPHTRVPLLGWFLCSYAHFGTFSCSLQTQGLKSPPCWSCYSLKARSWAKSQTCKAMGEGVMLYWICVKDMNHPAISWEFGPWSRAHGACGGC